MSPEVDSEVGPGAGSEEQAARRARRRRLEEVFGTTPEQTSDDLDPDGGGAGGSGRPDWQGRSTRDAWLRDQVPPHHGG